MDAFNKLLVMFLLPTIWRCGDLLHLRVEQHVWIFQNCDGSNTPE